MISRGRIRLHLFVILSGLAVFGALFNRLLLAKGLHSMVARNLVVMPFSYGLFFILVRMWLEWLKNNSDALQAVANHSAMALEPTPLQTKLEARNIKLPKQKSRWWEIFDVPIDYGEFSLIFFCIILLLFVIAWIGVEGPTVLIDAAFEVSLSVGLIQASRNLARGGWHKSLLKRTLVPFLLVLALSSGLESLAVNSCPGRDRLSEITRECWRL